MERLDIRPTVRDVLDQLGAEKLLPEGWRPEVARDILEGKPPYEDQAHLPWYVRLLMGLGAWVSMSFTLGFLGAVGLFDARPAVVFLGLCCALSGLWLRRASSSDFLVQLSLALSLSGRAMIYGGMSDSSEAFTAATALLVELAMIAVFPDATNRFVSTLGAWYALLYLLHVGKPPDALFHLATGALSALVAWVWLAQPKLLARGLTEHHAPVGFGLSAALLATLLGLGMGDMKGSWAAGSVVLLVCLASGENILRELGASPRSRALAAGLIAAVGAVTFGSPGVPAALLVMALAFHRRSPLLLGLATAFLAVFGFQYYHSMALSLLAKSGVLVASGLLLLGARALVERQKAEP